MKKVVFSLAMLLFASSAAFASTTTNALVTEDVKNVIPVVTTNIQGVVSFSSSLLKGVELLQHPCPEGTYYKKTVKKRSYLFGMFKSEKVVHDCLPMPN